MLVLASLILRGFIAGLLASIPPGPVMILCTQRTLSGGRRSGFVSGLGAAAADSLFAVAAFFSVAFVVRLVEDNILIFKIVAGVVVAGIGLKVMLSNPVMRIRRNHAGKTRLWHDFLTVFGMTLANPAFIFIYIFLFAALGIDHASGTILRSSLTLAGVVLGDVAWWFILSSLVSLLRRRFRPRHLLRIDRISGAAIIVLGIGVVMTAFFNSPIDGILP